MKITFASPLACSLASFVLVALISGCAGTSVYPPLSLFDDPNNTLKRKDDSAVAEHVTALKVYSGFDKAVKAASADDASLTDATKQSHFLLEGMAIVNYRCGQYFDNLGQAVQQLSFQRKETSLFGGLLQGSMGLANQSAKAIANTGAAFGFGTSSMDAYQEAFTYTPDIDALRRLIFAALHENAKQIDDEISGSDLTYSQVVSYLKQYESNCQPAAIKTQVNQAVNRSTIDQSNPQASIAASALAIAMNMPSLTQDQIFYMYWLQSDLRKPRDEDLLTKQLRDVKSAFAPAGTLLPQPNAQSLVAPYLKLLPKSVTDAWTKRIATEQAAISAPTPAAAAAAAPAQVKSAPKLNSVAGTPNIPNR